LQPNSRNERRHDCADDPGFQLHPSARSQATENEVVPFVFIFASLMAEEMQQLVCIFE
jgi:hypothetical protein